MSVNIATLDLVARKNIKKTRVALQTKFAEKRAEIKKQREAIEAEIKTIAPTK